MWHRYDIIYVKTVKNRGEMAKFLDFDTNILENIWFSSDLWQKFLGMNSKTWKKVWDKK